MRLTPFSLGNLPRRPIASRPCMKRLLLLLALSVLAVSVARAQFGSFGDVPIEITSESTRMEGGLAIAEQNVIIRYAETSIYCDYAQYNPDTRDVLLVGNVRIYRDGKLFTSERALYNLETKILNTAEVRGEFHPFLFSGESLTSMGSGYLVKDGIFTTSDNSKPDYRLRARTVRVYPKDRVIFSNVTLYVGRTPVFWYPYLYQSLNADNSFTFTPGYESSWGAFLLTTSTFPLFNNTVEGKLRVDLYSDRGVGAGFEMDWGEAKHSASPFAKATETKTEAKAREIKTGDNWGRFISYYIDDSNPGTNKTALGREPISPERYRISMQDRTYWTSDIYSTVNINKLSDKRFLEDFEQNTFRDNPNPDNLLALTKLDEDYSLILEARKQLNPDQDGTEKLPELNLDIKRQPLGKWGLFWDSETSVGEYRRNFSDQSPFPDYNAFRADSYIQLSRPETYWGWLSVVPHAGLRGTYYTNSGFIQQNTTSKTVSTTTIGPDGLPVTTTSTQTNTTENLIQNGGLFRVAATADLEASFKFSKTWENVESRRWGLDGIRHVVQPYMDASFVYTNVNPDQILQFDRYNRTTQPPPIDFPAFNAVDAIDNWSIVRLGVRNRLQTKRDDQTMNWLELDTYLDINIDRPDFGNASPVSDGGLFSNLYNNLTWSPLPWFGLSVKSQVPLFDTGFYEINTSLSFMPTRDFSIGIGQRYLDGNKQFNNSNLGTVSLYYRLDDNWAFSCAEQYEFAEHLLEGQTYEIHRDLSSWVASLGLSVSDNGGTKNYGVILTFTLKDLPGVHIPFAFDPSSVTDLGGKNK